MSTEKFGEAAKRRLDLSIHVARDTLLCGRALAAYDRVVHCVRSRSALLARRASHGIDVVAALLAMARDRHDWLAEPDQWAPRAEAPWLVLGSLAEHLFARYPMPRFMTSAWLASPQQRRWYKHLGAGQSIRTAGVSMNVTRAVERHFLKAPHHLTVIAALRWGQVRALGGSDDLARTIVRTRLGRSLDHQVFWESALSFLLDNTWLDHARIPTIVKFAHEERFGSGRQPDASFQDLFEQWHRRQGRTPRVAPWRPWTGAQRAWPRSKVRDFASGGWTIHELCTSDELRAEGAAMRHCVFTYVNRCVAGHSSIWSMKLDTPEGAERVLTIEVDVGARVVRQAKRKCNAAPEAREKRVLAEWAAREGLTVPGALRP